MPIDIQRRKAFARGSQLLDLLDMRLAMGVMERKADGNLESFPESWLEERNGIERLRSYRKKRSPVSYMITSDGRHGAGGREFWFIPGKFAFCLCCQDEPNQGMRERSKLAGLSGEGRSSATTLLVSSAVNRH